MVNVDGRWSSGGESVAHQATSDFRGHESEIVIAVARKRMSPTAYPPLAEQATELVKMLSAFIRYLRRSDWKDRF